MQRDRSSKLCAQRPRKACRNTTRLKNMFPHVVVLKMIVKVVDLHKLHSILRTGF